MPDARCPMPDARCPNFDKFGFLTFKYFRIFIIKITMFSLSFAFLDKSYFLFTPSLASCQALKSKKEEKSSRTIRESFRALALETAKIQQNPPETVRRKIQDEKFKMRNSLPCGCEILLCRLAKKGRKFFWRKGEVLHRKPEIKRKMPKRKIPSDH